MLTHHYLWAKWRFDVAVERLPVELSNARLREQREVMEGILDDGVCPFCITSLTKYHRKPILETGTHWLVTENQWPYENTELHLLLIARKHIRSLSEFGDDVGPAFSELGSLAAKYLQNHGTDSGSLGMRIGDPSVTGGTVDHLHAHLLKIDTNAPPGTSLKMKLGIVR